MIKSTFVLALSATLSAAVYPSLLICWLACLVWSVHFYGLHEIKQDRGEGRQATYMVLAFGGLLSIFYAIAAGPEFTLMMMTAVLATLSMRIVFAGCFKTQQAANS